MSVFLYLSVWYYIVCFVLFAVSLFVLFSLIAVYVCFYRAMCAFVMQLTYLYTE